MVSSRTKGRILTRMILMTLAEAGGGLVQSFLDPYGRTRFANQFIEQGKIDRMRMRKKLLALEKQGLLTLREKKHEIAISLTPTGLLQAHRYKIEDMKLLKPEHWDRKWRMVLFDVPEEHRSVRNIFKQKLDDLGFVQLQHSVYVHPYACHNEIEYIRTAYDIKQYVKMVIVDKIEGETVLRKHFDL